MTIEHTFGAIDAASDDTIASALHVARKAAGLSQRSVVERARRFNCKVSASTLSNWETGKTLPNADHLQALGHVYETRFVLGHDRVVSLDAEEWAVVCRILGVEGGGFGSGRGAGARGSRFGAALRSLIDAVARDEVRTEPSLTVRDAASLLDLDESSDPESLPLVVVVEEGAPRCPSFQFDFVRRCIRPEVASVNQLLDAANDSAAVLSWWCNANGRLPNGQSPRDLLDTDDRAFVVELAQSLVGDVG